MVNYQDAGIVKMTKLDPITIILTVKVVQSAKDAITVKEIEHVKTVKMAIYSKTTKSNATFQLSF